MNNQRAGKFHRAAMNDDGGGNITLQQLITFCAQAEDALRSEGDEDAALRFEIMKDWLREDVSNGARFTFTNKALGL